MGTQRSTPFVSLDSRKRARSTTRWQSWFGPSALALFAYAGQIKGSPLLTWVEVDLTLLLGCLVALAFAIGLSRAGLPAPTVFVPLGLMAILLFGAFDLAPSGYPLSKVLTLYTFTLLSMTAPFVLLRTESQRKQFLVSLTALALVVTILTLVSPGTVSAYSTVVVLEGSNTIGTARMIATGVVIVLVTMVGARTSMSVRILMAAIATVMMLATVSSGSRGPFLALAIAFFGVLITAPEFRMFRRRAIVGAVVLSVVGVYALANAGGEGFARVFGFLAGERDESAEIRRFLWAQAIRAIEAFPLGLGWGSFIHVPGVTRFGIGDKLYPS